MLHDYWRGRGIPCRPAKCLPPICSACAPTGRGFPAVCRATNINRQQFQRYLSGTVPYERNLEKICNYFGLRAEDMFTPVVVEPGDAPISEKTWWSHVDLRAALKLVHSDTRPSIPAGLYFVNFAVPGMPDFIVRSAMIIRHDGNLTTFRRLTGTAEAKGSWWSQFHGDHKGVVIERAHWPHFVGLNSRGSREPSLMSVRWLPGSRQMLGGQAMVMGPAGPRAAAVVIDRCNPSLKLRTAVKASHAYSIDDVGIEPIIIDTLDEQTRLLGETIDRGEAAAAKPARRRSA